MFDNDRATNNDIDVVQTMEGNDDVMNIKVNNDGDPKIIDHSLNGGLNEENKGEEKTALDVIDEEDSNYQRGQTIENPEKALIAEGEGGAETQEQAEDAADGGDMER